MRITTIILAAILALLTGCQEKSREENSSNAIDEEVLSDTLLTEEEPEAEFPPSSADVLFDDFIYDFMRIKNFQMQRIKFPIDNFVDGENKPIAEKAWKFDPLYANKEVYTMLFDNEKSIGKEKDTAVHQVTVEWIYLKNDRIKQYYFVKNKGKWMLDHLDTHAISQNPNSDFLHFYGRFATDTVFQSQHVSRLITFKTYDSDSYQEIEGVLDAAQWPDFRPDMPQEVITNINYGQTYTLNKERIMVIAGLSSGMSCTLHFKKSGGKWKLAGIRTI